MDAGGGPDAENLDRLRDMCADLAGELGNGQLHAWADASVPAAVPDVVFGVVSDAGLLADSDPMGRTLAPSPRRRQRQKVSVPADARAALAGCGATKPSPRRSSRRWPA